MARFIGRSRFPAVAVRGQRRKTAWLSNPPALFTFTTSGGTLLGSLAAGALLLRPFTIVRYRGVLQVTSDQIANTEDQVGAYAMAVVSDEAVAVGITAVPTPITDQDSDLFFVYQSFLNSFYVSSAIGTGKRGEIYHIDSKAMRKVEIGQDLIIVAELSAVGEGFRIIDQGRFLLKLH